MKRMMLMACAAMLVLEASSVVTAQPGGDRRGRGRGNWWAGRDTNASSLLMSEEVRNELEIVDDQMNELTAIGEQMRDEMRGLWSGMRDISADERQQRMDEIRGKMQEMRTKVDDRVKEVLLPNQLARLKQINLQNQIKTRGTAGALGNSEVADVLGLTEEQKRQLQEKAEVVQRELQEKIEKLRNEARDELLDVLTTEQREKLNGLMGDQFDLQRMQGRGQEVRGYGRQRGQGGPRGERRGRRENPSAAPASE